MLDHKQTTRYRNVRKDIVAQAIEDFHATTFSGMSTALDSIREYLRLTPSTEWCRRIVKLIDTNSTDTPDDRVSLRNSVLSLLPYDPHVGLCFLDCMVAFCVRRGLMTLPQDVECPPSTCTLPDALHSLT